MDPIESLVSGAMGRRIRIATSTASPTEICRAWPAGVTLSCKRQRHTVSRLEELMPIVAGRSQEDTQQTEQAVTMQAES